MRKQQSGVMLLEALIAILIFSLGVLGVVGMQVMSINASRDAKLRVDADLLANELVGQMRVANRDGETLKKDFASTSTVTSTVEGEEPTTTDKDCSTDTSYDKWCKRVMDTLPRSDEFKPVVNVVSMGNVATPNTPSSSSEVHITVRWCSPNENCGSKPHQHFVVAQIF